MGRGLLGKVSRPLSLNSYSTFKYFLQNSGNPVLEDAIKNLIDAVNRLMNSIEEQNSYMRLNMKGEVNKNEDLSNNVGIDYVKLFWVSDNKSLWNEKVVAEVLDCSLQKLQKDRWAGGGIPYKKTGTSVRYQKKDVLKYIDFSSKKHTSQK